MPLPLLLLAPLAVAATTTTATTTSTAVIVGATVGGLVTAGGGGYGIWRYFRRPRKEQPQNVPVIIAEVFGERSVSPADLPHDFQSNLRNESVQLPSATTESIDPPAAEINQDSLGNETSEQVNVKLSDVRNKRTLPYNILSEKQKLIDNKKTDEATLTTACTVMKSLFEEINPEISYDSSSFQGYNSLHFAARIGKPDDIEDLLDEQFVGNETITANQYNALHIAVLYNRADNVSLLLKEKEYLLTESDSKGCTPLGLAVRKQHTGILNRLLEKHPDPFDACKSQGLFHIAAECGNQESISALISYFQKQIQEQKIKKDQLRDALNSVNARGETPIALAKKYDHSNIVEILLTHGATVTLSRQDSTASSSSSRSMQVIKEHTAELKLLAKRLVSVECLEEALKHHQKNDRLSKSLNESSDKTVSQLQIDCVNSLLANANFPSIIRDLKNEDKMNFQKDCKDFLCEMDIHVFKGNPHKFTTDYRKDRQQKLDNFFKGLFSEAGLKRYVSVDDSSISQANRESARAAASDVPLSSNPSTFYSKPSTKRQRDPVCEDFMGRFVQTFCDLVNACESVDSKLVERKLTKGENMADIATKIMEKFPVNLKTNIPFNFLSLTLDTNDLVVLGFKFYGYICKVKDMSRIQTLSGLFKTSGALNKTDEIKQAAQKIYQRYEKQFSLIEGGNNGVNRAADFAALCAINYILNHDWAKEKPGLLAQAKRAARKTVSSTTAEPELVTTYYKKDDLIYEGVIYSNVNSIKGESDNSQIRFESGQDWDLKNIFRNPRIRAEDGKLYTTNEIEKASRDQGIDFGECLGTLNEKKKRGFRLMEKKELEAYEANQYTGLKQKESPCPTKLVV